MAKKLYEESNIQAIADAIREKTGTDTKYNTSEMIQGINDVEYAIGLSHWKAITRDGKRTEWRGADGYTPFMYTDYSGVKFPKPIAMTGSVDRTFRLYKGKIMPRKQDIDMSGVTSVNSTFSYIYSISGGGVIIPDYGIPAMDLYTSTYNNAQSVKTIELIRSHKDTTFTTTFNSCNTLEDVRFEGVIGTNISFPNSPLTVDSLKDIILHLYDYSVEAPYIYTVTFKASAFAVLDDEGLTASWIDKDGTPGLCTWEEYIDNIGWNLVKQS